MNSLVAAKRAIGTLILATSALASTSAAAQESDPPTTVILVRHSEKAAQGRDPGLTDEGRERGRALAHALGESPIDAVYATQFARTKQTARPLANRLGIPVTVVPASAGYAVDMVRIIRSRHMGQTIVVVSHSNTVPAIIAALGATPVPSIDEDEYDDLYVVTVLSTGDAHVMNLRFGRPTP